MSWIDFLSKQPITERSPTTRQVVFLIASCCQTDKTGKTITTMPLSLLPAYNDKASILLAGARENAALCAEKRGWKCLTGSLQLVAPGSRFLSHLVLFHSHGIFPVLPGVRVRQRWWTPDIDTAPPPLYPTLILPSHRERVQRRQSDTNRPFLV